MLSGSLSDFSIDDIFQLFALTKKSGALHVRSSDVEARVDFTGGDVIFAVADTRRMALGARLVAAGVLTEQRLRAIASGRDGRGALTFAVALLRSDEVETSVVTDFLRDEVHESVSRLLRLEDGSFTFDNADAVADWPGPSFTSADLLAEARRRLLEWEAISAQVPSLDVPLSLVPMLADGRDSASISREQWQTLALIDGRRTATDLVDLTGKGEFVTCKLVAALISDGLIELRPQQGRTALEELLAGREALRKLEDVDLGAAASPEHEAAAVAADDDSGPDTDADADETGIGDEAIEPPTPEDVDAGEADQRADDAAEPETDDADGVDADDDDAPPAARRDVNVDRVQMARELASLGFGDQAPVRRTVNRAAATPRDAGAAHAVADDTDAQARAGAPEQETMVEHHLARPDPNRGRLMRLIGGVQGA